MMSTLRKIIRKVFPETKIHLPAWFMENFKEFQNQQIDTTPRFLLSQDDFYACLKDKTQVTPFDRHYIYHPAWAAQVLAHTKPSKHIDISSTLHFSTMLAAFIPTEFYDYRPAGIELNNYQSAKADLTSLFFESNSVTSLSCMHTVEHIGLGRYGDPIDYDGDIKAMNELARVLAPGGNLLFVTPVGKQNRIFFNAHRVYTASSIKKHFEKNHLKIRQFSYIPEKEGGLQVVSPDLFETNDSYGCGCFWLTK